MLLVFNDIFINAYNVNMITVKTCFTMPQVIYFTQLETFFMTRLHLTNKTTGKID